MPAAAAASPPPLFLQSGPITLFGAGWLDAERAPSSPKHARRRKSAEREGEKWRNANYAEMSRIFHGKSTGERSEGKREGNINIPLPQLACSSLFPLPPSLPFCFLSRVAFDSAKLHENVSPSISLKSHRSGLHGGEQPGSDAGSSVA